ncbi:hypothetical protein EYF80_056215 [Liparis tanakae]|uniref:Uncharacterized protein n=1 Tax=Liparis tanakae TaxID=230148 RepID=A0A4Z2EXN3_9TELE|nr:hypothetical protein EYF80_056215 [Liparis tanakae]
MSAAQLGPLETPWDPLGPPGPPWTHMSTLSQFNGAKSQTTSDPHGYDKRRRACGHHWVPFRWVLQVGPLQVGPLQVGPLQVGPSGRTSCRHTPPEQNMHRRRFIINICAAADQISLIVVEVEQLQQSASLWRLRFCVWGLLMSTRVHTGPRGSTRVHAGPHGSTRVHAGPRGSTRVH